MGFSTIENQKAFWVAFFQEMSPEEKKEWCRQYRIDNKDKLDSYNAEWKSLNPELTKRYRKKSQDNYYQRNVEQRRKDSKHYRLKNPEKVAATKKEWYERNKAKEVKRARDWAIANKERRALNAKLWYERKKQELK